MWFLLLFLSALCGAVFSVQLQNGNISPLLNPISSKSKHNIGISISKAQKTTTPATDISKTLEEDRLSDHSLKKIIGKYLYAV